MSLLTRRQALGRLGAGAAVLTAGSVAAAGSLGGCSLLGRRPNVILILADDLGSVDLRCYGSQDLITPNLDGLARDGLRFTQFYVQAPACTPSRASLMTGRHFLRAVEPSKGMSGDEVTIAEMLKPADYRTACIGKWHLGFADGMYAQDQGFDTFFGYNNGCLDNYSHYYYWGGAERHVLMKGRQTWHEDGAYFPDLVTREALRFIEADDGRPFFLYLPLNIPHYPIQPDPAWRQRYVHIADPARREYAAYVSTMDERLGRILTRLEELGQRRDTIVIFLSDHGHSTEERSGGGGSAGFLRGGKTTLWEGGIRVPFLLSWPGGLPAGQVRTQPASTLDLLPTLAQFCGVPLPDRQLDGVGLEDVCEAADADPPHDVMHWVYQREWAVREGPWKMVGTLPVGSAGKPDPAHEKLFLANLAQDPSERIDQKESYPAVAQRLVNLHNAWVTQLAKDDFVRAHWVPPS